MPLPLLVLNADDFGISGAVTRQIVSCFQAGRISSTSVMANLPGFPEAAALAHEHRFADRVGVHLNLTLGPPLSELSLPFCGPGGGLAFAQRHLFARPDVLRAVHAELRAQVERVVGAGIRPTHLDSHEHIINGFPYSRMAIRVAREFGISRIRLTRNAFYVRRPLKVAAKGLYNTYLRVSGMRTVRYFTDVKPYLTHVCRGGRPLAGPIELMCHPGKALDRALYGVDNETDLLLSSEFERFLAGVRLASYADL